MSDTPAFSVLQARAQKLLDVGHYDPVRHEVWLLETRDLLRDLVAYAVPQSQEKEFDPYARVQIQPEQVLAYRPAMTPVTAQPRPYVDAAPLDAVPQGEEARVDLDNCRQILAADMSLETPSEPLPSLRHPLPVPSVAFSLYGLVQETRALRRDREATAGVLSMTIHQLGGMVEGRPTERVNFLQRVNELVAKEQELAAARASLARYAEQVKEVTAFYTRTHDGKTNWGIVNTLEALAREMEQDAKP